MPSPGTEHRKLAAIMFTDMVDYSALAQRDEALALELLEEHRRVLRGLFPEHQGTEIKTTGDGFLVEFASALAAVRCAIEIQEVIAGRNATAPDGKTFQIRIGIHVGDVVRRENDVFGDGVNIAARIEPLAEPGGICISEDVARQVQNKLPQTFVKFGPAELKNIQLPVVVYKLSSGAANAGATAPSARRPSSLSRSTQVFAVILPVVLGVSVWMIGKFWPTKSVISSIPSAKPSARITSLAVKPLDDYSGDTNNAYLSDGMTDAFCAALGNISALRVPGRSTVMRYKHSPKSIPEMAKELSVDAVVEGSIQRAGNRILVTVQLVEGATDRHLWAARFERDMGDFFKVQGEVAQAIADEIQVRLTPEDRARLGRARTVNPDALEAYLRGMESFWNWSDKGVSNAFNYFQQAIKIDPNYAPAHAGIAIAYYNEKEGPREAMPKVLAAAQEAIRLDPMLGDAYVIRGWVRLQFDWNWAEAEKDFRHGLDLAPNSSYALDTYFSFLVQREKFDEAIAYAQKALKLDPRSPALNADLGWVYDMAGHPELATPHLVKALQLETNFAYGHFILSENHRLLGKTNEAVAEVEKVVALDPGPQSVAALGYIYGVVGRRAEALQQLAKLDELSRTRFVGNYWRAMISMGLGQKETALDFLEKAYDDRGDTMPWLKLFPHLAPLRNEPRFQALLKKVGLDK